MDEVSKALMTIEILENIVKKNTFTYEEAPQLNMVYSFLNNLRSAMETKKKELENEQETNN